LGPPDSFGIGTGGKPSTCLRRGGLIESSEGDKNIKRMHRRTGKQENKQTIKQKSQNWANHQATDQPSMLLSSILLFFSFCTSSIYTFFTSSNATGGKPSTWFPPERLVE